MDGPPDRSRPDARQRWRLVTRRTIDAASSTQRELAEAWEEAVMASGLPVAYSDAAVPRPRLSFGAPLPVGIAAEAELIDLFLTERLPTWRVREALARRLPAGWELVDLYDVWPAGPPLAGRVVAADYRIAIAAETQEIVTATDVGRAVAHLMAARTLPRERVKGGGTVRYDLRPLIADIDVVDAGPPVVIRARTRFHPELGTGRPDEVVAALGGALGRPVVAASITRERLILAD